MESHALLPHHSVQWLNNQGEGRFVHGTINTLPGTYGTATGDLDRDGDLDFISC